MQDEKEEKKTALLAKLKDYKSWLTPDKLVMGVLIGALLLVIALPTNDQKKNAASGTDGGSAVGADGVAALQSSEQTEAVYCRELEEKLKAMLGKVAGVGNAEVMITLETSRESVLNKDQPIERENIEESQTDGTKQTHSYKNQEETVMASVDGDEMPYVVKSIYPKIQGVVVVAQGADVPAVKNEIIEAVEVLFGVEAHKVKVLGME